MKLSQRDIVVLLSRRAGLCGPTKSASAGSILSSLLGRVRAPGVFGQEFQRYAGRSLGLGLPTLGLVAVGAPLVANRVTSRMGANLDSTVSRVADNAVTSMQRVQESARSNLDLLRQALPQLRRETMGELSEAVTGTRQPDAAAADLWPGALTRALGTGGEYATGMGVRPLHHGLGAATAGALLGRLLEPSRGPDDENRYQRGVLRGLLSGVGAAAGSQLANAYRPEGVGEFPARLGGLALGGAGTALLSRLLF